MAAKKNKQRSRVLELAYIKGPSINSYDENKSYSIISAKDSSIKPNEALIESGIDVGLFKLHMHNAPERRKILGLKRDQRYEVLISFTPAIQFGESKDKMDITYGKFFRITKNDNADGFSYKKMFKNLRFDEALEFDVALTEIDNNKVDPDPLEQLLNETSIGQLLDLAPYQPKTYLLLASQLIQNIQRIFGADKDGDDALWADRLSIEAAPTITGSYRLRTGIYAIIERPSDGLEYNKLVFNNNCIQFKNSGRELNSNYLVFGIGKSRKLKNK